MRFANSGTVSFHGSVLLVMLSRLRIHDSGLVEHHFLKVAWPCRGIVWIVRLQRILRECLFEVLCDLTPARIVEALAPVHKQRGWLVLRTETDVQCCPRLLNEGCRTLGLLTWLNLAGRAAGIGCRILGEPAGAEVCTRP